MFSKLRWKWHKFFATAPTATLVKGYCLRVVSPDALKEAMQKIEEESSILLQSKNEEEIYLVCEDDELHFSVTVNGRSFQSVQIV